MIEIEIDLSDYKELNTPDKLAGWIKGYLAEMGHPAETEVRVFVANECGRQMVYGRKNVQD